MKSAIVIVGLVPLAILFYAACSVAPETEAVGNASVEESPPDTAEEEASPADTPPDTAEEEASPADTTEEEAVASDAQELRWLVNCRKLDRVECMIKCAEAGVPCRPSYKHPYKRNAGDGNLTGCIKKPKEICVYHYPSNGDGCFVVRKTDRAYCVYVGGRR